MAGKCFVERVPDDSVHTLWAKKFHRNCSILHCFQDNEFLYFTQTFKMAAKNGGKMIFDKNCQIPLLIAWGPKILSKSLYLAVSEINAFLRFTQKNQDDC